MLRQSAGETDELEASLMAASSVWFESTTEEADFHDVFVHCSQLMIRQQTGPTVLLSTGSQVISRPANVVISWDLRVTFGFATC